MRLSVLKTPGDESLEPVSLCLTRARVSKGHVLWG